MQLAGQARPPVGVVFDTGLTRIDDALAMAVLYGFDGKNEIRVISFSVTRSNLKAAAFCEVVGSFYAGAVSAAFGAVGRTLPIGMATDGKLAEDERWFVEPLERSDADGKPVYKHAIHRMIDTADPIAVMRNALTGQYDANAIVLLSGPATNLANLLALHGAKEWITRKVKFLVVAAGAYPYGPAESCIKLDVGAAQKLFAEWPTPIVACGAEIGSALQYPASSIEKDFAWTTMHPVVDAYRTYRSMPYDAPGEAIAAALYAARPKETYFQLSDPGTITVTPEGRTKFSASADGKHRYVIVNADQKDRIIKSFTEIASAKPVPRPRFPRPPQDKQKQQDKEKAEAKQ